jgi:CBS domain-containing protein
VPAGLEVDERGLREPHERARGGREQEERREEDAEPRRERRDDERDRERDAAAEEERTPPSRVRDRPERELDDRSDGIRNRQEDSDRGVAQAEVVPDQRPGSLTGAEDELVEQLDGKQRDNEERSAAEAPLPSELAGCARHARRSLRPFAVERGRKCHDRTQRGGSMATSVRELMTSNPTTIESGGTVAEAARKMRDEDAGIIPIVDGDRLVGTITDRDVAISVVAEGKDPESTTVGEIASRDLVTIDPQQDLDEALRLMAQHQVRRLPVVEEDGRLVGILAQADIAREASPEQTGRVVEEISE